MYKGIYKNKKFWIKKEKDIYDNTESWTIKIGRKKHPYGYMSFAYALAAVVPMKQYGYYIRDAAIQGIDIQDTGRDVLKDISILCNIDSRVDYIDINKINKLFIGIVNYNFNWISYLKQSKLDKGPIYYLKMLYSTINFTKKYIYGKRPINVSFRGRVYDFDNLSFKGIPCDSIYYYCDDYKEYIEYCSGEYGCPSNLRVIILRTIRIYNESLIKSKFKVPFNQNRKIHWTHTLKQCPIAKKSLYLFIKTYFQIFQITIKDPKNKIPRQIKIKK